MSNFNTPSSCTLHKPDAPINVSISLPASKSISNRLLIIQALCKEKFVVKNISPADDTKILQESLAKIHSNSKSIDVGLAGTTYRFLTAYLTTVTDGEYTLTGSERLKQRPIKPLVDALRSMGAKIEYTAEEGHAPLKIMGAALNGSEVIIKGDVSSQFISALMLIGPVLKNGLTIIIDGELVSRPYLVITMKLMAMFGVNITWKGNKIAIPATEYSVKSLAVDNNENKYIEVEADWTSASYWYAIAALSRGAVITLEGLRQNSIQGDSILPALFTFFGVATEFDGLHYTLKHTGKHEERFGYDFSDNPDLAQTVAVVASALKVPCMMNGLKTLRDKETDRVNALKEQLAKVGVKTVPMYNDGLLLDPSMFTIPSTLSIATYNDHRMAMAFAPLAQLTNELIIESPAVVNKSYPEFWTDMVKAGFKIK